MEEVFGNFRVEVRIKFGEKEIIEMYESFSLSMN